MFRRDIADDILSELNQIVSNYNQKLNKKEQKFKVVIFGSYASDKKFIGDLDLLVFCPPQLEKDFKKKLLTIFNRKRVNWEILNGYRRGIKDSKNKFHVQVFINKYNLHQFLKVSRGNNKIRILEYP